MGHDWVEATCTEPKTCSRCGETEGEPLGHNWIEATYETPKTCSRCGATEGEPAQYRFFDLDFHEFMQKFNKKYSGQMEIVRSDDAVYLTVAGSGLSTEGLVNVILVVPTLESGDYVDNTARFNVLHLCYFPYPQSTLDTDSAAAIGILGEKTAEVFDETMSDYIMLDSLEWSSYADGITAKGSVNGFDYNLIGTAVDSDSGQMMYDFIISLTDNK